MIRARALEDIELDSLAQLWFDAWRDGHAEIVPDAVMRARTRESCRARLAKMRPATRVAGPVGTPVGFHFIKEDELEQFFVAASSRGTGIAAVLLTDAEAQLRSKGVATAWLACAIGNERAARFYEKNGWHRAGAMINRLDLAGEPFDLEVWRYEKDLSQRSRS